MIHNPKEVLKDVYEKVAFINSMYLTGGISIAPVNIETFGQQIRLLKLELDTLECRVNELPQGKNLKS